MKHRKVRVDLEVERRDKTIPALRSITTPTAQVERKISRSGRRRNNTGRNRGVY